MELQHLLHIGIRIAGHGAPPWRLAPARRGVGELLTCPPPPEEPAPPSAAPSAPAQPATAAKSRTRALYMDGTYVFEHAAKVLGVWRDGDKVCVELDQTIFHPQGGGQPSDVGTIEAEGLPPLEVAFVVHDKERAGVVRHDCRGDLERWKAAGQPQVVCKVDEAKRRLHARVHSAGHLLDVAVHACGFEWRPGKGYHFPDGPYVEYLPTDSGRQLDNKDPKAKEALVGELNSKLKALIAEGIDVKVEFLDGQRIVTFSDQSCGCGGTHVENTRELVGVEVKKLQAKQGNMRVSYTLK